MLAAAPALSLLASLLVVAVSVACMLESTFRSPPSSSSTVSALAKATKGSSSPMSLPIRASTALNRTFCEAQPMVLKARVAPTADPPELMVAVFSAVMSATLSA